MKLFQYNKISGPKTSTLDYIRSLTNDELKTIYQASSSYGVQITGLIKHVQHELMRRKITIQPTLF